MTPFILLVVTVCVAAAQQGEEKGICLDPKMMAAMCSYNTDIGAKMEKAHKECAAADRRGQGQGQVHVELGQEHREQGQAHADLGLEHAGLGLDLAELGQAHAELGQGQARSGDCTVNFQLIIDFFNKVWEKKACVLKSVGWVDEEGNVDPETIMTDLQSLPAALSLSVRDTQQLCMNRSMEATLENVFSSEQFGAEAEVESGSSSSESESEEEPCVPQIDQMELLDVEIVLQKLAFFRCVHENFMEGCGNYILGAVQQMMGSMAGPNTASP